MSKKGLYTKFEEKYGAVFASLTYEKSDKLSEEEAKEKYDTGEATGVNFEDRIKFLEDNGYEVNRKNLTDSSLSARPKEEEDN